MPKVLLGFDFGMYKIGVAVGQIVTQSANPLPTLKAKDGIPVWEAIDMLIQIWKVEALVVGIPYNMDGSEQEMSFAAKKFANRLKDRYRLPVFKVDERLTTNEAKRALKMNESDLSELDSVAAKLILESWFREQH